MPRCPAPLPPALGAAFTTAEARSAGASRARLRASDLTAPHRGVRIAMMPTAGATPVDDPLQQTQRVAEAARNRCRAYGVVMHPDAFFVGRTALALLRLPLERMPHERLAGDAIIRGDEPLEVGVFAPRQAPRARGIQGMQTTRALVTVRRVDDLRVASPASTWAALAGRLDVPGLIRLGDALVRVPRDDRGHPLPAERHATPAELRAAADVPHRRGRRRLRAALDGIRVGSGSPLESDWRMDAEAAGLPRFDLDVEIRSESGRLLGIADAAHAGSRTIVEVEGDHHRTSRPQWSRDIEKHAAYASAGWEVVRLTGAHIRGRRAVPILRAVLLRRGWHP